MRLEFAEENFSDKFDSIYCAIQQQHDQSWRPGEHRGTATAVITENGDVFIGVSICTPEDNFFPKVGRVKSLGRAFSASASIAPSATVDLVSETLQLELTAIMQNAIQSRKRIIEKRRKEKIVTKLAKHAEESALKMSQVRYSGAE